MRSRAWMNDDSWNDDSCHATRRRTCPWMKSGGAWRKICLWMSEPLLRIGLWENMCLVERSRKFEVICALNGQERNIEGSNCIEEEEDVEC